MNCSTPGLQTLPTARDKRSLNLRLVLAERLGFAFDTFVTNKFRFVLTALGMTIGTASLVLVVSIGLTGKQYVLGLIQGIGSNLIYASYGGGAQRVTPVALDELTLDDVTAVRQQVPSVVAALTCPLLSFK